MEILHWPFFRWTLNFILARLLLDWKQVFAKDPRLPFWPFFAFFLRRQLLLIGTILIVTIPRLCTAMNK